MVCIYASISGVALINFQFDFPMGVNAIKINLYDFYILLGEYHVSSLILRFCHKLPKCSTL